MHKTAAETAAFFDAFLPLCRTFRRQSRSSSHRRLPRFARPARRLRGTRVRLGAQTMHWELEGLYRRDQRTDAAASSACATSSSDIPNAAPSCRKPTAPSTSKCTTALARGSDARSSRSERRPRSATPACTTSAWSRRRARHSQASHAAGLARVRRRLRADLGDRHRARTATPDEANRVMGAIRASLDGLEQSASCTAAA